VRDDIKLLEELTVEAVDRLRRLTVERDSLREQVGDLKERLDALKRKAAEGEPGSEAERAWKARQAESLVVLREALSELRDDVGAV
jgi:predicted  nucleic acid-binding Zn-ribbon protein